MPNKSFVPFPKVNKSPEEFSFDDESLLMDIDAHNLPLDDFPIQDDELMRLRERHGEEEEKNNEIKTLEDKIASLEEEIKNKEKSISQALIHLAKTEASIKNSTQKRIDTAIQNATLEIVRKHLPEAVEEQIKKLTLEEGDAGVSFYATAATAEKLACSQIQVRRDVPENCILAETENGNLILSL